MLTLLQHINDETFPDGERNWPAIKTAKMDHHSWKCTIAGFSWKKSGKRMVFLYWQIDLCEKVVPTIDFFCELLSHHPKKKGWKAF